MQQRPLFLRITTPKILVFLRKFGSLAGLLRQNQNIRVLNFSAGERKLKYPGPGFWIQPGIRGSNRTHLFFVLLRASVPPWCKGLVFLVAATSRRGSLATHHSLPRRMAAITRGLRRPWITAITIRGFSSGA